MIQYLKSKVKKSNKVNNNNNAKLGPKFGKELITSPNQVEKGNWNQESQNPEALYKIAEYKKLLKAIDVLERKMQMPKQQNADHNTEQNGLRAFSEILLQNRHERASFNALNNAMNQSLTQHRTQSLTPHRTNIAIQFNGKQYHVPLKPLKTFIKAAIRIQGGKDEMPLNGQRSIDNGKQAKLGPNFGNNKNQGDTKYWMEQARREGMKANIPNR
jgi:hypothetical protein